MKRLIYALFLVFTVSMVSCTEQSLNDETVQIEKDKVCPPGNPNCND